MYLALNFLVVSLFSTMRLLFLQPKSDQVTALFKKCQWLSITSAWGTPVPFPDLSSFFSSVNPELCSDHHMELRAFPQVLLSCLQTFKCTFLIVGSAFPPNPPPLQILGNVFIYPSRHDSKSILLWSLPGWPLAPLTSATSVNYGTYLLMLGVVLVIAQ